jgi:cyanate permease
MAKDQTTDLLLIAAIAGAAYYLYSNGTLAQWFPSIFQNPGATALTSLTPVSTLTVAPASVSIAGPVTLNQANESLSANVTINGVQYSVTIGIANGVASDSNGNNITATLQALGVNIPSLLSMMQSAYSASTTSSSSSSGTSGLGLISRVPLRLIHGGMR